MSRHRCTTLFTTIVTILLAGVFMTGCGSSKTSTIAPSGTTPKVADTAPTTTPTTSTSVTPTPADQVTPSDATQESVKINALLPQC